MKAERKRSGDKRLCGRVDRTASVMELESNCLKETRQGITNMSKTAMEMTNKQAIDILRASEKRGRVLSLSGVQLGSSWM